MFFNCSNEDINSFVADLINSNFYYQRDVVALYFSKSRAAVMTGYIDYPEQNMIRRTRIKGKRVYLPSPKSALNISLGEAANPKLEELELLKRQNAKVLHNPYAPLKYVLNSYSSEEIDFEGEFKNEVHGLEEIWDYLISENRIVISDVKVKISEIMVKPHYKYCMQLLLREFKGKLF